MRERINRLSKGIIDAEIPQILITPLMVDKAVRADESAKGEILVVSENDLHIKGLAYSTNVRVKLITPSFGGLRNHVLYEINSCYLEDGDEIKGSFYLVTNGGEKEIPYSFRVENGESGKTLKSLQTPGDLADIAVKDMETALRLFDYQDFTEAPFMKDLHTRALYDGLKGRPNRRNGLEEFLVAMKVKDPVELLVDCDDKVYENPTEIIKDSITIVTSGWGYIHMEVKAEGDFLELPKKSITDADFTDGKCDLIFYLHPQRLHRGRNFGRITVTAAKEVHTISVLTASYKTDGQKGTSGFDKKSFFKYLKLRLDYESGLFDPVVLQNEMLTELMQAERFSDQNDLLTLFHAELHLMQGHREQAVFLLDECRDRIMADRQEQLGLYCFYQYLRLIISRNPDHKESLVRLINKYLEEVTERGNLLLLLVKLDRRLEDNPGILLTKMKHQFQKGFRSPFLYTRACKVLDQAPEFLRVIDSFELQTLIYGAKNGLLGLELSLAASRLVKGSRHFNKLYFRLFMLLYEKYPRKEILEAICSMLIKEGHKNPEAFIWYELGVEKGISLTRLYEYYLDTLPMEYPRLLPREVLLYFSYGNELDRYSKAKLYRNILTFMKPDEPLRKDYERDMEKFAVGQIFDSRIDSSLAVIYDHMIYKDVIDIPLARVLPSILRSNRISCNNPLMRYLVVCYEELEYEDMYHLENGAAYVPLFSENCILLLQDVYGNRYASIPYEIKPVMHKPVLEKRCFEIYPEHPMMRLTACSGIIKRGAADNQEAKMLERSLDHLKLHPLYKKSMLSAVIDFYRKKTAEDDGQTEKSGNNYLLRLDKAALSKDERQGICETLIIQDSIHEAYDMILSYGCEGISSKRLLKLCSRMILKNLFSQNDLLLGLAYQIFADGQTDSVILDYLCEHFNGTVSQMYKVLLKSVADHVETYDLEERLVAQMLFSGNTEKIDRVFDLYLTRKKTNENIVKAYFTFKSAEYFLEDQTPDDRVFFYLEGAVNGYLEKEKIPVIYLLALTRFYSAQEALSKEQIELCRGMVSILLDERLVFPYFKLLTRFIALPEDILDKGMIEYRGSKTSKIDLRIRILPDEEEYHSEDMRRVYQGIFVKQKVLFEGEILEYQIYELSKEGRILKKEGSVTCQTPSVKNGDSRFDCLNEMGLYLNLKEEIHLKNKMEEYIKKNAVAEELFNLM